MNWFRSWHDMPTDPKWRVVARKSGQEISRVLSVWNLLMVNASANGSERGTLCNWSNEDAAAVLDLSELDVEAIFDAMQGKVLDGDRLTGWEKRQPKQEDGSAERAKRWRERQRTEANGTERPEKSRGEKKRVETPAAHDPPTNGGKPHPVRPVKQQQDTNTFPKSTGYIHEQFPKTDGPFSAKLIAIGAKTFPDIRDDELLLMLSGSLDKTQYSSGLWLKKLGPYIEQNIGLLMKGRAKELICKICGGDRRIIDPRFYIPSIANPGQFTLSEAYGLAGPERDIPCPDCGIQESEPASAPPGIARIRDPDRADAAPPLRLVGGGR